MSVTKKYFVGNVDASKNLKKINEEKFGVAKVIRQKGESNKFPGKTVYGRQFRNISQKIEEETPTIQKTSNGFKISVKTYKENSFDTQGLQKIQQLIERFYQYGYLHLDIFVPNTLSENEKQQLIANNQDFNFSINDHNFNEEETNFFERVYQFQGQKENEISPLLEMCIYQQNLFPNLKQEASKQGFTFKVDFDNLSCQIPVPNNQNFQFIDLQKFFVTNIQKKIQNSKILKIKTYTNREAIIKFQLLKKLQDQKPCKFQELQGQLVLIKLNELEQRIQNVDKILKLKKELIKNTIFLIINSKGLDSEVEALQFNIDQFTSPLIGILKQNTMVKKIDDKFMYEQLNINEIEQIASEYGNVDIICGFDETKKNINQITINQYYIDKEQIFLTHSQIQEIYDKVLNVIQAEIEISLDKEQLDVWNYYLKFEVEKFQLRFEQIISQIDKSFSNQSDILLKFPRQQDRNIKINKLKHLLDICEIKYFKINCHKQICDLLKQTPDVTKLFQKQIYNMTSETVYAIRIVNCESNQIKFCIIKSNSSSQDISTQIYHQLQEFINIQLQKTEKEFYCFQQNNFQIIIGQYENNILHEYIPKQNMIHLIGIKSDLQKIEQELESLPQPNQINLIGLNSQFLEYLGAGNSELYSVENEVDQKTTIKFYQENFGKVINQIQEITCSTIKFEIKDKSFNGESKWKDQIFDIAKQNNIGIDFEIIYSLNPENLVEVELQTSSIQKTKKRQIKLISGNISEVQCQALVIQNYYESIDFLSKSNCFKQLRLLYEQASNRQEFQSFLLKNSQNIELFQLNILGNSQPKIIIYISPNSYNSIVKNNNYYLPNIQKMLIKNIFQIFHKNNIQEAIFQVLGAGVVKTEYVAASKLLLRELTDQLENQSYDISQVFIAEADKDLIKVLRNQFFKYSNYSNEEQQIEYQYVQQQKKNLTKILNFGLQEFITENLDFLKKNENYRLDLPIQYDETPSHRIDFSSKKICNLSNFQTQNLEKYEILGQKIYFIDDQQVDSSLNDYLSFLQDKMESEDQANFDINLNQEQVIFSQNQLFLVDSKGTKINLLKKLSDNDFQNEFQFATQQTEFDKKIYTWKQVQSDQSKQSTIKIALNYKVIIHSDQNTNLDQVKAQLCSVAKSRGLEISICKQ